MLIIAGHDPTGGAGIVADAQTVTSLGAHPVTVCTALTVQDTNDVKRFQPTGPELVDEQLEVLLADIEFKAVKVGMLGSAEIAGIVKNRIAGLGLPLVLDPVLASGAGSSLSDEAVVGAIRHELLSMTELLTPNTHELKLLGETDDPEQAAANIISAGARQVLVTGTHDDTDDVINRLYPDGREYRWPRLGPEFHGSGCTLSTAAAALLARGLELPLAVAEAQEFTWQALVRAYRVSAHQMIPARARY